MSQNDENHDDILAHYGEEFTNFLVEQDADEIVEHFGVKGMKWGRRNSESKARDARQAKEDAANPEVTVTRATGKKITTRGGGNLPAHDDAVTARVVKQKIDNSGLNAVSNQELQSYVNRLNLEQNYARLSPNQTSKGEQFAKGAGEKGKRVAENVVTQVVSEVLKSALKSQVKKAFK